MRDHAALVEMKTLTCADCGSDFVVPRRRGQPRKRCDNCDPRYQSDAERERRRANRKAERERQAAERKRLAGVRAAERVARDQESAERRLREDAEQDEAERQRRIAKARAERERRQAEQAEHEAMRKRAEAEAAAATEQAIRLAEEHLDINRAAGRALFDPLWSDDRVLAMLAEVIDAALLAAEIPYEQRNRLGIRKAIVSLARAQGCEGTREAALALAAAALAFAASIPHAGLREPKTVILERVLAGLT